MRNEVKFIDGDLTVPLTSTVKTLLNGDWKFSLDTADVAATIAIEEKAAGGINWQPVMTGDPANPSAVALTSATPHIVIESAGEDFRAVRTGGTGAVTVLAALIRPGDSV